MNLKYNKIALFGWPGAGKGTQAGLLTQKTGLPHISTGDLFRELQKNNSPLAQKIKNILSSGELVSDELVTKIAFERLSKPDCSNGFLLDGYPRTTTQAQEIQNSPHKLDYLVLLDVSKDLIIRRLSGRRVCPSCNFVTHIDKYSETFCPKDHSDLVMRPDDDPKAIIKRLDIFDKNFRPVRDFFHKIGCLKVINAVGSEQEIFERIVNNLGISGLTT